MPSCSNYRGSKGSIINSLLESSIWYIRYCCCFTNLNRKQANRHPSQLPFCEGCSSFNDEHFLWKVKKFSAADKIQCSCGKVSTKDYVSPLKFTNKGNLSVQKCCNLILSSENNYRIIYGDKIKSSLSVKLISQWLM